MASVELTTLRVRIMELRHRLLPARWPLLATPTQSERARAFTLLAHAEVETYLENVVLGYVDRRVTEWLVGGSPSMCVVGLVKTAQRVVKSADTDQLSIQDVVLLGKRQLSSYITTRNHGVRERQLSRLFIPIGLELAMLPSGFSQTMDAWGRRRGGYAHQGGFVAIPTPKSEYDDARQIIDYLVKIDRKLSQ